MFEELVIKVFKNYLDEYIEVFWLIIVGGYVYNNLYIFDDFEIILFGCIKIDFMCYYYCEVIFVGGVIEYVVWKVWILMEIQINVVWVYLVYVFGWIFVFWVILE